MMAILKVRTFRHLFSAQVIALLGTGLTSVALALLAHDLAGDNAGAVLGTALAIKMVAYVGIAPLVGAYASRLPRRTWLITMDLTRATVVCLLPFVTQVWQIYVLMFVLNACSAGFTPVFQACLPDVLPDDADYTRALSLSRLAYDLENLFSPVLAAALLTMLSFNLLFLFNGAAFLMSALLIVSVLLPSQAADQEILGIRQRISLGLRIYLKTPRLRGLLALNMAVSAAGAMQIVNTVVYVRSHLGMDQRSVALAFAAVGAGSMLVALGLPRLLERFHDRTLMLMGAALLTVSLLLGSSLPGHSGLLVLWFMVGAGSSMVMTPTGRLLKQSCLPPDRTAVFAAQFSLSHACWLAAYLLAGWLGVYVGLSGTFVVLGMVSLLGAGLAAFLWPSIDPAELDHEHEAVTHAHWHVHDEHHQHEHQGWEGPEPHRHEHHHERAHHRHAFVIDGHHGSWPEVK